MKMFPLAARAFELVEVRGTVVDVTATGTLHVTGRKVRWVGSRRGVRRDTSRSSAHRVSVPNSTVPFADHCRARGVHVLVRVERAGVWPFLRTSVGVHHASNHPDPALD